MLEKTEVKAKSFDIERNAARDGKIPITLIPFKIESNSLLVSSLELDS